MREFIEKTMSLCPECEKKIQAEIFAEDNIVWIEKECEKHGKVKEKYWEDYELYKKAKKFSHEGKGVENPQIKFKSPNCPFDCGLCKDHKSHTALANIVVTNRCDLRCWYCFYYAKENDPIYEPSIGQIRAMLKNLKAAKPIGANAVQITGGEPSLRDDIIEIIRVCREEGFEHVQYNTNGIRLANEEGFAQKLVDAGVSTLYMSFDGVTPKTNPKNHWEVKKAIENCRKAKLGIVLVPTIIKGVNDNEVGDILKFAIQNTDIVRGVNFQPVSLVGRMPHQQREKQRITIPAVIDAMDKQTNGMLSKDDFYPVPCVSSVSGLIEGFTGNEQYDLSTHFACGMATYVFLDGNEVIPITSFVDVVGLFKLFDEVTVDLKKGGSKEIAKFKLLFNMPKYINRAKMPKGIDFLKLFYNLIVKKDYSALAEMHHKMLFVGLMHFQDLYNYDVKRVEKCEIHYAMPDGKVIPFCAFNVLPAIYRDRVQNEFSIPAKEWEKKHGKRLKDDRYIRKLGAIGSFTESSLKKPKEIEVKAGIRLNGKPNAK
ncbi:MAG: radical SAM protein [Candidatus Diapherotrites archaeon]